MNTARWALLVVAFALAFIAFRATAVDLSPSLLRLAVAGIAALLCPWFWPGVSTTPPRTAVRVVIWSAGGAAAALLLIRALGGPVQSPAALLQLLSTLLPLLVVVHAAAALLEDRLLRRAFSAGSAREAACRVVLPVLALLAALPVFLGPAAERLAARHPSSIDSVLAASPLTHLAVASGNDLLRNAWLYEHSNLAALAVSYPDALPLALCYAATATGAIALVALGRRRAQPDPSPSIDPQTEKPS